ncbi:MAG: hypothetical protein AN484_02250 [Aphanizomenon flos-aquae WA102]|uniref:Restriction endonuclease type IV Mrr domain-containing protein n=1 Tax=Aphanizomenon flos-aquae WA102 TaxID=1710896 RepID=A0A1B7X7P6_APHFL|nr:MAG: hypothetical protein AN484_02250 [Aphanizomenon flos-aquae WA102]
MFGVHENILSGQFGLHISQDYWADLDINYKSNIQVYNPLWVDEKFINGEQFFSIGNSPFGFGLGVINPKETRKILEGNFSDNLIKEVRNSGRAYTLEVHNSTRKIIEEINQDREVKKAILDSIDPYKFEELIAELLRSQGFDTFLTSKSGDGGRDIIAAFYENGREYLMMVECKRRRGNTVLGPIEARALLGQFYFEKVQGTGFNCAMLVTSAGSIGPSALNLQEGMTDLSIRGRNEIMEWISSYGAIYNNLWVPKRFNELF